MTGAQAEKAAKFFADLWISHFLDGASMDGEDLQNALERSGLTENRPATAAEVEGTDYEEGDTLTCLNDDGKALLAAAKVRP